MCLIVAHLPGSGPLGAASAVNAAAANPDGLGYAFVEDGEVFIRKGYQNAPSFYDDYIYDYWRCQEKSPFIIHFRKHTHGSKKIENEHPFYISGGRAALVHNGVMRTVPMTKGSTMSDTATLCKRFLQRVRPERFHEERTQALLTRVIGNLNRLAIITDDAKLTIINEGAIGGHWNDKKLMWCSNRSYQGTVTHYRKSGRTAERDFADDRASRDWKDVETEEAYAARSAPAITVYGGRHGGGHMPRDYDSLDADGDEYGYGNRGTWENRAGFKNTVDAVLGPPTKPAANGSLILTPTPVNGVIDHTASVSAELVLAARAAEDAEADMLEDKREELSKFKSDDDIQLIIEEMLDMPAMKDLSVAVRETISLAVYAAAWRLEKAYAASVPLDDVKV